MTTITLPDDQLRTSNNDMRFGIFHLVWLDAAIEATDVQSTERQLRSIINHLKKFHDLEECRKYIQQCSQIDRIIMIVSSELGQEIISSLYQIRQITSIYIYSIDQKINAQWADKFPKVKAVVFEIDQLILLIKADYKMQRKTEEPLSVNFFKTDLYAEKSIKDMNDQFILSQVVIDYLPRIKSSETDTKELITLCEQQYADNSLELNNLREFQQNYSPEQALSWYTRKSFFADTLNAILSKKDIYLIFLFRAFIADIQNALKKLQPDNFLRVYRSQIMTKNELENWKQFSGQFISVNSFFPASTDYHRVVSSLNIPDVTDNLEAVLFEIDADPTIVAAKSFADNNSQHEFDILFAVGSIFRITAVNRSSNGLMWIIRMALRSDDEYDIKEILMPMKQEAECGERSLQNLGKILCKMEKFNLAEYYYSYLIERFPSKHPLLGDFYEGLSELATQTGDTAKSAQWHEKAVQLKPSSAPTIPARKRRLLKDLGQLNKVSATDDESSTIFILDKTSDNDSSLIDSQTWFVILGRILPTRGVFKEAAFQIKIEVAAEYPFKAPKIRFVTPIYHPNISAAGGVFLNCLSDAWSPRTVLVDVIKALVDVIDYPSVDYPINPEATEQYKTLKAQFNRIASEMIAKHGLPRDQ